VLGVIAAEAVEAQEAPVARQERQERQEPSQQVSERAEAVAFAAPEVREAREDREVREPAPQQVRAERPAPVQAPVQASAAPIVVETAKAPAAASAANGRALPKVQAFELPMNELAQIAESSGLQWVNSDADRIAQARAAIAAEPKSVHVPRERPPVVVVDEGPLVLVETRRDLGAMSLPFEQAATPAEQQRAL
jgi:ribonuclease E